MNSRIEISKHLVNIRNINVLPDQQFNRTHFKLNFVVINIDKSEHSKVQSDSKVISIQLRCYLYNTN